MTQDLKFTSECKYNIVYTRMSAIILCHLSGQCMAILSVMFSNIVTEQIYASGWYTVWVNLAERNTN